MFSATMPDNILQLAQSLLQEPETVMVTPPAATADRVEQSLCMVGSQAEKRPLTLDLLEQQEQPGRTLIFTRTIALCSPDEIKKARDVHKLLGRLLPVHSSSATIPSELQTVPGTHRERKNSMQENRSASRRGPRKSYGRRNSAGRQGSRAGA